MGSEIPSRSAPGASRASKILGGTARAGKANAAVAGHDVAAERVDFAAGGIKGGFNLRVSSTRRDSVSRETSAPGGPESRMIQLLQYMGSIQLDSAGKGARVTV